MPDEFWHDDALQAAFDSRHIGKVIRAYRHHPYHGRRGVTQDDIGVWADISQGQVSTIEGGPPINNLDRLISWARLLGIPGEHLWFKLPDDHDAAVRSKRPRQAHVADRVATAGAVTPARRDVGLEPLERMADLSQVAERIRWLRATNVDDESLQQFHSLIREVAEIYEDAGARGVYELVLHQRQHVDVLLRGHQAPSHRIELLLIAGRLTVLLGHLAFDLSSDTLADAYSAEAWAIGDVCGNNGLLATVRSAQSFMAYYRGDYASAAEYATDAVLYAGARPEGVQAAVHQARAHARLGDRDAVDGAIGRAFELRGSLTEPDTPRPFLAFAPYDTARVAGNAATAYLSLGATSQVVEYAEMALPVLAAYGSRAGQALTRLDSASAHLIGDTPDPERAADEAHQAIDAVGGLRSAVLARRAEEFRRVANRWRDVRAIGAAADHLNDWTAAPSAEPRP